MRKLLERCTPQNPEQDCLLVLWYYVYATYSTTPPKFLHVHPPSPEFWDDEFYTVQQLRILHVDFPRVSDFFAAQNFCIIPSPEGNGYMVYDAILQSYVCGNAPTNIYDTATTA